MLPMIPIHINKDAYTCQEIYFNGPRFLCSQTALLAIHDGRAMWICWKIGNACYIYLYAETACRIKCTGAGRATTGLKAGDSVSLEPILVMLLTVWRNLSAVNKNSCNFAARPAICRIQQRMNLDNIPQSGIQSRCLKVMADRNSDHSPDRSHL